MKLAVNIEFDSLEEYLEFNGLIQNFFAKRKVHKKTTITPTKTIVKKQSKTTSKDVSERIHTIPNFKPPEDMLLKVKEFIHKQQRFRTSDVASSSIMNNPNRRAMANKWLQQHPELIFEYIKESGKGGKGHLVYAPIHYVNGKTVLPTIKSPDKTDWPIKGATIRKQYHPSFVHDSENDFSELFLTEDQTVKAARHLG